MHTHNPLQSIPLLIGLQHAPESVGLKRSSWMWRATLPESKSSSLLPSQLRQSM